MNCHQPDDGTLMHRNNRVHDPYECGHFLGGVHSLQDTDNLKISPSLRPTQVEYPSVHPLLYEYMYLSSRQ